MRAVRLGLRLGLFQLSLGILGVLILGLPESSPDHRDWRVCRFDGFGDWGPAADGLHRAWFGNRSDRIPSGRLRRTPFIVMGSLAISLLFGLTGWVVLQLAKTMPLANPSFLGGWIGLLLLISIATGQQLLLEAQHFLP